MDSHSKLFLVVIVIILVLCLSLMLVSSVLADPLPPKSDYGYWINANKGLQILVDTDLATGIDVSKWRGELDPEFDDEVVSEILDFIIIRAGYVSAKDDTIKTDEQFYNNYRMLKKNPEVIRGVYWYHSSFHSWYEQFDYFVHIIKYLDFDFIALDYEDLYNEMSEEFAIDTVLFMDALIREFPDKKVFLYSHQHFYLEYISELHEPFDLWVAEWPMPYWSSISHWGVHSFLTKVMNGTHQPQMPRTLFQDDWEIWQFGDKTGLGYFLGAETYDVDFNVSRRTYPEFVKFVGIPERWTDEILVNKLLVSEPAIDSGVRMEDVNPWILDRLGPVAYESNCDYWRTEEDVECNSYPCLQEIDFTRFHGDLLEERADRSFNINLLRLRPTQLIGITVELDRELGEGDGFWIAPFLGADINLTEFSEGIYGYLNEDRNLSIQYQLDTPASVINAEFMICEVVDG